MTRGVDANRVNALITLVASAASAVFVVLADSVWAVASDRPKDLIVFAGLALIASVPPSFRSSRTAPTAPITSTTAAATTPSANSRRRQ